MAKRDSPSAEGNRLGALALALGDRMSEATALAGGNVQSGPAALSALQHFLDRPSIDQLAQVLGLTHSGTVRLVDRLEADRYVRRDRGRDGRSVALSLTAAGRRKAAQLGNARTDVLEGALSALSIAERKALDELVSRLLVGAMRGPGATQWICRLCDTGACGRGSGGCPIERESQVRYGDTLDTNSPRGDDP